MSLEYVPSRTKPVQDLSDMVAVCYLGALCGRFYDLADRIRKR